MPVASETSRIQYAGNGSTVTPYSVPFYFLNEADIRVVLADAEGVESLLTETTHYALTGAGDEAGGSLTTVVAYDETHTLTIYREPEQTQSAEFQSTGALPADTLTRGLDKLTMLVQSLARKVSRCFRLNDKAGDVAALSEATKANTVFGFGADGEPSLRDRVELLSLLSLSGSVQGAPTAFWVDDGERVLKVPDFVGQLGLQLDTSVVYRSTGLGAGSWSVLSLSGMAGQIAAGNIPDALIGYGKLQPVSATKRLLGRNSAGAGVAEEVTLTQLLDWIGSAAQGDVLYRGATSWQRLPAGTAGLPLITRGAGMDPAWEAPYASGTIVKKSTSTTNNSFSTSSSIPIDDTPPQIGEGIEVLSTSFTPKLASSTIVVRAFCYVDHSTLGHIVGALFVTGISDALNAAEAHTDPGARPMCFSLAGVYTNANTSSKTFSLRFGTNTGTAYINRTMGGDFFGTSSRIVLEVEEIAP